MNCGNGIRDIGENCDDGLNDNLHGCNSGCFTGPITNFTCTGGSPSATDNCTESLGIFAQN